MRVRDLCITLCTFAYLCIGASTTIMETAVAEPIVPIIEEIEEAVIQAEVTNYHHVYVQNTSFRFLLDTTPVTYTKEIQDIEEYNCLMYATVPIGNYYITAYNHKETGSKLTASGATCHEGTITTCAIDPKLHRFGEVFEITVNGVPRLFVAEDTGSAVLKRHVDIYFSSYKQMSRYGSNYQNISRVEFPFGKPNYA